MELDDVRDLVRAHGHDGDPRPLGAGYDNEAYLVGDLVVRLPKVPDLERVGQEARLLEAVAAISPLPVPEVVFVDHERGCIAYRYLPGTPLIDLPRPAGEAVLEDLGRFIEQTHAATMAGIVPVDDYGPAEWHEETLGTYEEIGKNVPDERRPAIERFLAEPPPVASPERVFSHNDLGAEHILLDPDTGVITGVIDWSDAELTDPAHDFATLHRDLGQSVVDRLIRTQPADVRERALFYARCDVLEDLAFGVRGGRQNYADKAVAALAWLF